MTHHNTPQDHYKFLQNKLDTKLANLDSSKVRGDQLNMAAQKYLKQWLGIPSRGCTSLGIFSSSLLGTKPVSQVYLEWHVASYTNSTLVADQDTKEALRCAVEREGKCFIPTPDNCSNY